MHAPDPATQDAIDRIRAAQADRTPLCLKGGGTKDFYGGAVAGTVLDTRPLRGILSYEPSELVVTVRSGTPLAELEAALAEKGQCLPFEPPHFSWSNDGHATVGGMVASGLSGPSRASVGGVRDYVLGLELINGQGQALTFGGQVMKNVAGYDVSRLMVGAMGTLGLITQVSLKVLPFAPAEATLKFDLNQNDALAQLHRWGAQPLPLNASVWHDQLRVRLRGAAAAVEAAARSMAAELPARRLDNPQAQAQWTQCRNQTLPFFQIPPTPLSALWRLSLPQTAPALDLPWPTLVEWHGGVRWVWAPHDAAAVLQPLMERLGGNAMIFIAATAGGTSAKGLFSTTSSAKDQIQQRLKASFDPQGIFNSGRMVGVR